MKCPRCGAMLRDTDTPDVCEACGAVFCPNCNDDVYTCPDCGHNEGEDDA